MVLVVDYGMGNVGSVLNALNYLGAKGIVSNKKSDFKKASHIILQGVGSFGDGMSNLRAAGLADILNNEVLENQKPFLGICLGMQMLAGRGEEGGKHKGLGWIKGTVRRFRVNEKKFRLPHVGWNDVSIEEKSVLFDGVNNPIFYFVHSYHFEISEKGIIEGKCKYGETFNAVVEKGHIFGVQFHPEKSQGEGIKVISNFINLKNESG